MARLVPVSIAGIEFDCLMNNTESYSAEIPSYAVEEGYAVSDSIILKPLELSLSLIVSDTPVTWANRTGHYPEKGRTNQVCEKMRNLYMEKKLLKVVTTNAIYTNMGITSFSIKRSANAATIDINLRKVYKTSKKTVVIYSQSTMTGTSQASAGTASTSSSSSKTSGNSTGSTSSSSSSSSSSSTSSSNNSSSSKACSVLYGVASSLKLIS